MLKDAIKKKFDLSPEAFGLHLGMPDTEWMISVIIWLDKKSKLLGFSLSKKYPMYTVQQRNKYGKIFSYENPQLASFSNHAEEKFSPEAFIKLRDLCFKENMRAEFLKMGIETSRFYLFRKTAKSTTGLDSLDDIFPLFWDKHRDFVEKIFEFASNFQRLETEI